MNAAHASQQIRAEASRLGFALVGICPAVGPPGARRLDEWLDCGYAGEMHYFSERRGAYDHPRHVLEGARSLVMLALPYCTESPREAATGQGRVSRYAWSGIDYHDIVRRRMRPLADQLQEFFPEASVRGVVDTAPLLERDFAVLAGLGWVGKNGLLLNRQYGSWFFLSAIITDVELSYDVTTEMDHCGTCRACLDACPTDAFIAPYRLDPRRCISYLTIELPGPIPGKLRENVNDWVFGCDVCQDVCPWNHQVPRSTESTFQPLDSSNPLNLGDLFHLEDDAFRRRFRRTPLWRPKRRGLLRNAAIALGNRPHQAAIAPLTLGLQDEDFLVRGACAWALGRHPFASARDALKRRLPREVDDGVANEIRAGISHVDALLTS